VWSCSFKTFFFSFALSSFAVALATCFGYASFPTAGRIREGAVRAELAEGQYLNPLFESNEFGIGTCGGP